MYLQLSNYYTVQNVPNKKGNTNNRIRQIWNKKSRKWVTNKWTENRITQAVSAKKERTAKNRKKEAVLASGYLFGTARNFKKYQISRILAAVRYGTVPITKYFVISRKKPFCPPPWTPKTKQRKHKGTSQLSQQP